MRTKPYRMKDLWEIIIKKLEDTGKYPQGFLDYDIFTGANREILTHQFTFGNSLEYGGSEGIYLTLYLVTYETGMQEARRQLGTFKTLESNDEAMRKMGVLLADFIILGTEFVNANLEDFTWTGYRVTPYKENGEPAYSIGVKDKEKAIAEMDFIFDRNPGKYPKIEIRNNETRKSVTFTHSDEAGFEDD